MVVVVAGAGRVDLREHPLERGLAEPAHRPRGQPDAVVVPGEVALPLELALQLAQRPEVGHRTRTQLTLQRLDVHVVQRAAGPVHRECLLQRLEVGELGDRLDRVAVAERLAAVAHLHRPPVQPGPQRPEVVGELGHLRGEVGVGERVAHQLAELLALLR